MNIHRDNDSKRNKPTFMLWGTHLGIIKYYGNLPNEPGSGFLKIFFGFLKQKSHHHL